MKFVLFCEGDTEQRSLPAFLRRWLDSQLPQQRVGVQPVPAFYPADIKTAEERLVWAKKHVEDQVDDKGFRQYFAVHEVEAWLLSQPDLFPPDVKKKLPGKVREPESINFTEPPSYLLNRLYNQATGRSYKKVMYGTDLFDKLDSAIVRAKCPAFRQMTDDLVGIAQKAIG